MSATILDGRQLAGLIKQQVADSVILRHKKELKIPGLAVILVGDDPASNIYVQHKRRACEAVGIHSEYHPLPSNVSQAALEDLIDHCNENPKIHGILLQLPLPKHLNRSRLIERIRPEKDVDGFHPYNIGRLVQRRPLLRPCTPWGIMQLLATIPVELRGLHCVIIGASNIVGRPMALESLLAKCTITVCHRFTKDLPTHVNNADIVIAAIGKTGVIHSSWIKPGAIVIDVGINRLEDGTVVGDIDFDSAKTIAGWITPVPGGVGPMTVATLLENTLLAASLQD